MLTLYDFTRAPSPRRARFFLAEKGIEYNCVQVDFASGEQLSDSFKAINPRCAVPVLVTEDGDAICENVAIAQYLEALHPTPNLLGKTPLDQARVSEWNWRVEFEGLMAVAEVLRNTSDAMKGRAMTGPRNVEQMPELAARGKERLAYFFEDLNAQLDAHPYVAGDAFSLADITAVTCMDFSKWIKLYPNDSLTALHSWHKKIAARPSYTA